MADFENPWKDESQNNWGKQQSDGVYIDKSSNYTTIQNGPGRSNALQFKTVVYSIKNGKRTVLYNNINMFSNGAKDEKGKYIYYIDRNTLPDNRYTLEYTPVYRPNGSQYGNGFYIDKTTALPIVLHSGTYVSSYAGCWGISQYKAEIGTDAYGDYIWFHEDMQAIIDRIYNTSVKSIPVYLRPNQ